MSNTQALAILKLAAELVEGARKAFPDLQEDTEACRAAVELRSLLDPLRICSECGQASGNVTDVCAGCWESYQARMRAEDRAEEVFCCPVCGVYNGAEGLCANCQDDLDEQRDRDWEGEALALREAQLDAAVSPFDEA